MRQGIYVLSFNPCGFDDVDGPYGQGQTQAIFSTKPDIKIRTVHLDPVCENTL
jgi:hypothetical protein